MGLSDIWKALQSGFLIFEWQDVIDILLIAVIVYQVIILSKQTRAVQVVKGLAGVLACYFLARNFNLIAVTWLLDKLLGAGALVLVIIFQPELRRALEKIGRGRIMGNKRSGVSNEEEALRTAYAIANAMKNMSKRRVGALIVVENRTGLGEIIATGTRINGDVSANLLEQMFEPNTPLHDGAVVIQGNTLVSAGCFLPLTDNSTLSSLLGTRHRAALGVSEISDAFVFVVSEETGTMSLAREGQLTRPITTEDIVSLLSELNTAPSTHYWDRLKMFFGRGSA